MITAKTAHELTEGSMKCKGYWFKLKLAWICGCINKKIENTAEIGDSFIRINYPSNVIKKYCPIIAKLYERQGYLVGYRFYDEVLEIRWDNDFYRLTHEGEYIRSWDYCTKEEYKNESIGSSCRDRKNKRTTRTGSKK